MMVGNKIRALGARLTLLVVDDDGMSTVEYSTVDLYTQFGRNTKFTENALRRGSGGPAIARPHLSARSRVLNYRVVLVWSGGTLSGRP